MEKWQIKSEFLITAEYLAGIKLSSNDPISCYFCRVFLNNLFLSVRRMDSYFIIIFPSKSKAAKRYFNTGFFVLSRERNNLRIESAIA